MAGTRVALRHESDETNAAAKKNPKPNKIDQEGVHMWQLIAVTWSIYSKYFNYKIAGLL